MNILIFNGSQDTLKSSTSAMIIRLIEELIEGKGHTATIFHLANVPIPFLDLKSKTVPDEVRRMAQAFRAAHAHIWLSPLYHGSIPGAMKNCLDWLEVTSKEPEPYLTGKIIGLVCWSGGLQAMQGINTMDAVAKALRAWVLPLSIPISKIVLFDAEGKITSYYKKKFNQMIDLLSSAESQFINKTV